jgi:hypothetical protein
VCCWTGSGDWYQREPDLPRQGFSQHKKMAMGNKPIAIGAAYLM